MPELPPLPLTQTIAIPPIIGQSLGPYKVLSPLGKGGMGEVYLATDALLQRRVALKLLPSEFTGDRNRVRRFEHEAKAASALNHPNIVSIYGLGESEFGQYIVMELIEGRNLRACQPLPLPPASVRDIGMQAAKALEITHAAGLIHRDIKPDNIMIRHDGLVKVLDFGLARLVGPITELMETGSFTQPGAIMGTISYMSPEQARGEWLTAASDIFSLGIVFYELATGRHPFQADSGIGFLHAIVSRQAIPPARLNPDIPSWLETLMLRMLEKDPAKRCSAAEVVASFQQQDAGRAGGSGAAAKSTRVAVGRRKERAQLHSMLQLALEGRSSILCISGEPGQGKTTLVEEFLMDVVNRNSALVARGRCSERLAGAEAYLPILETLDSLMNGVERDTVAAAMKSLAPTWYAQLSPAAAPQAQGGPPSSEKLKRELAALLQEISRQQALVIFLDDVQWADLSTVDLLAYLGTRLDAIRTLIVMGYRSSEAHSSNQQFLALQLELQARGVCREIALGFFAVEEIQEYLDRKFARHAFPAEFAHRIHERTEGNPLFVTDLLRYLQERQAIVLQDGRWTLTGPVAEVLTDLPESVRSMVQRKMEQLDESERRMLMAASVQGADFDAAVVARALDADPAEIEEGLEQLERRSGFVRLVAEYEYPDRSLTLRYSFVHVLYQNAFFAALRPTRRISLSKVVAEALLQFHGAHAGKIAAQLAFLFETARDFERAAGQYQAASQNALQFFANREAETLARRGLDAARSVAESADRDRQELALLKVLAGALRNLKSHSGQEAIATQRRLLELAERLNEHFTIFGVRYALAWGCITHQEFGKAMEAAERCREIAEELRNPALIAGAHLVCAEARIHSGRLTEARAHLEGISSQPDPALAFLYTNLLGADPCAHARGVLGMVLAYLGYPDQARAQLRASAELGRRMGNPIAHCVAMICEILSFKYFRDARALAAASEELIAVSLKNELHASMMYFAKFGQGWGMAMEGNAMEGLARIDEAIGDARAIGLIYGIPMMARGKAEVMQRAGLYDEALGFVDEQLAVAEGCGQWIEVPDLYRAKAECLSGAEAEEFLLKAIDAARRMEARMPELEGATQLARLYAAQNRKSEAREALGGVYGWFTEGFDTLPLRQAKAMWEEVSQ